MTKTRKDLFQELDFFKRAIKMVSASQYDAKKAIKISQFYYDRNPDFFQPHPNAIHKTLTKRQRTDKQFITRCIALIHVTKKEIENTYKT